MQVQGVQTPAFFDTRRSKVTNPGVMKVFRSITKTEGYRGMWVGHTGTLIRDIGGSVIWFGTKEAIASFLVSRRNRHDAASSDKNLTMLESAISGACAGVMFDLILFPADSVKSVMQTRDMFPGLIDRNGGAGASGSFMKTFVAMYRVNGMQGLYAGCGITMLKSALSSSLVFVLWDALNKTTLT
jgi:mitochondrial ornithine carrier protein